VTAHKSGGGPKPKLAAYDEALRAQVAQKADITLVELQAWLANDRAVKVSVGCLWARVRHLGLTLKKSRNAPQSRTAPTLPKRASNGGRSRPNGERTTWSLSTKPAHRPK
jgi:transposase